MTLLILSIAALVLGPLTYNVAGRGRAMLAILDGFVLAAIGGIVLLSVVPGTMAQGGWLTLIFVVVGFAGPTLAETLFHRAAKSAHVIALILGVLGFSLHALLDGTALAGNVSASQVSDPLPAAVVVHRFPVGLTIWWLLRPHFGLFVAALGLALVVGATAVGYVFGPPLGANLSVQSVAWFQALVGGSLLHVVFYRPHLDDAQAQTEDRESRARHLEGVGAIAGLLLVGLIMVGPARGGDAVVGEQIAVTLLTLGLESAPALLLAYVMAGLISAFMPGSSVAWMARGGSGAQAARGMAFGLPLPICSCGVVPLYRTLISKGAPPSAALAFLVATPELGLDAVLLSIPLLGGSMTAIRVVAAAMVAFVVGWLVGRLTPTASVAANDTADGDTGPRASLTARLGGGLRTGLVNVVDDTAPWILAGLGVAALAAPFLEGAPLAAIPGGVDVLLFAVLGVPTYVCASAATPMVAALLTGGLSPGAALAFLITGPATNVTTFGMLTQLHGRRLALTFSVAIIGLSVALGYVVNAFLADIPRISIQQFSAESVSPLQGAALTGLVVLFALSLIRRGPRGFLAELTFSGG